MSRLLFSEHFDKPRFDSRLQWLNPPSLWTVDRDLSALVIAPDAETDFWQKTHYDFSADSGHFLFARLTGDFVVTTKIRYRPVHQYDQAGIMVRISPDCWLKASIEYELEGPARLGAVVTNNGWSDWSTQPFPRRRREYWLRVRREGTDYIAEYSEDGSFWQQIRMARLLEDKAKGAVDCGLYACSPTGGGLVAEFEFLTFEQGRVEEKESLPLSQFTPAAKQRTSGGRPADLLSTSEVAEMLLVRPSILAKQAREGLIPGAEQRDGRWFIPRSSLDLISGRKSGRRAPR